MNRQPCVCPACEELSLSEYTFSDTFPHRGQELVVSGLVASRCASCEETFTSPDQLRRNRKTIAAAKAAYSDAVRAEIDRLTGECVRQIRKLLDLTQAEAACVFGGGPAAFPKYESGNTIQSEVMDNLLRVCEEVPAAGMYLIDRAVAVGRIPKRERCVAMTWKPIVGGAPALVPSADVVIQGALEPMQRGRPHMDWRDVPVALVAGQR